MLSVCLASGCTQKPAETGASGNTALAQAKQQYQQSAGRAKQWERNATLQRVYREYDGSLESDQPKPLTFTYASLANPTHVFEVEFASGGGQDRQAPAGALSLSYIPINADDWQVSPEKALETAEAGGGQEFREKHLAGYKLLEQLQHVNGHPPQWYFRYDSGDGSRLRHEIFVNAKDRTVQTQKDSVFSAGTPTR